MSDIFCHLRDHMECGCPPHLCAAAPVEDLTYRPTVRDMLAVALFIPVIAGIASFAVAYRMEQEIKRADLIAQENVTWKR